MQLARVDGNVTSSVCHPSMQGWRMLICQPIDDAGEDKGIPVLALDTLGAGLHAKVMISTDGSSTQEVVRDNNSPVRNMIIGIIDEKDEEAVS